NTGASCSRHSKPLLWDSTESNRTGHGARIDHGLHPFGRSLLRRVMPGLLEHPVLVRAGGHRRMMGGTAVDATGVAVDRDGWHRDWWLRDETRFDVGHGRIAGNEAEAVSIGVDDDVDEVGVVECGGRAFESHVVERPTRGPHLPEQPRDFAAVLRK